jgi:hypothetical protein
MTGAFALFGKRRRADDEPDDVITAAAAGNDYEAEAAPGREAVDESTLPRWRRPSLQQVRRADPLRAAVETPHISFESAGVVPLENFERRNIGYRVVRLLDSPDELRATEIGIVDQGDEVQLLERHGAYWLVLCPDGRQGWVHRMTLADAAQAVLPEDEPEPMPQYLTDETPEVAEYQQYPAYQEELGTDGLLEAYMKARGDVLRAIPAQETDAPAFAPAAEFLPDAPIVPAATEVTAVAAFMPTVEFEPVTAAEPVAAVEFEPATDIAPTADFALVTEFVSEPELVPEAAEFAPPVESVTAAGFEPATDLSPEAAEAVPAGSEFATAAARFEMAAAEFATAATQYAPAAGFAGAATQFAAAATEFAPATDFAAAAEFAGAATQFAGAATQFAAAAIEFAPAAEFAAAAAEFAAAAGELAPPAFESESEMPVVPEAEVPASPFSTEDSLSAGARAAGPTRAGERYSVRKSAGSRKAAAASRPGTRSRHPSR